MSRIEEIIHETLPTLVPDAFLVSLSGVQSGHVQVVVDTDAGITLTECIAINRGLADVLYEKLGDAFDAELEVASPGVGEPLVLPRQYVKNVGRKLQLRLSSGEIVQGELLAATPEQLELGVVTKFNPKSPHPPKQTPRSVPVADIAESKVILDYTA